MVFWSFTSGSPQKHVWGIENPRFWSDTRFGCGSRKCVLPERLARKLAEIAKIQKCLELICKFDAKTAQMHLNTSPTGFGGPRGRKIGFRDPGPENKVWVLPDYVHHQYGKHFEIFATFETSFASPPGRTHFQKLHPKQKSDIVKLQNTYGDRIGQIYVLLLLLPASRSRDWSHSIRLQNLC